MKKYIHLNRHINEAGVFNKIKKHTDLDDDGISKEKVSSVSSVVWTCLVKLNTSSVLRPLS